MNPVTTDQALHLALSHQKAGRLSEAQAIYQQILAADPRNPHALHLLGTIAMHAGQPRAESLIRAALELNPDYHEARFNLAVLLLTLNRPAEALPLLEHLIATCGERAQRVEPACGEQPSRVESTPGDRAQEVEPTPGERAQRVESTCGERAQRVEPNLPDLEFQYANALRAVGQLRASIPVYRNALAAQPDNPLRMNNLGVALKEDAQFDEAAELFRNVVLAQPHNAGAWTNLGSTLKELGRLEPAIDAHRRAIAEQPDLQQAHCNLANALQASGRFDEAVASFQTAVTLAPDFAVAHYNFGNCLLEMGRLDQAVQAFLRAVTLAPDLHQALGNLGNALKHSGQIDQSITVHRKALALRPDIPEFHFNLALLLLLTGQIEEGWREYQWRLRTSNYLAAHRQQFDLPQWDGAPLLGRSLFIHYEQGLGDTIHFARYVIALAAENPGRITLQIPPELRRLFKQLRHITLVESDAPPDDADLHLPIMSLPHILAEPAFATAGAKTPYLHADPARRSIWRKRLADAWRDSHASGTSPQPRLRVGLVWAGARGNAHDKRRSISLATYAPLARDDVQFVSLQVGQAAREADQPPTGFTLFDASPHLSDLADTADLLAQLDLVITVDTAVAHLAGAMGKPVWLLIPRVPDFRWLLDRTDSPWYPSMVLFRQSIAGQWADPISTVVRALAAGVAGTRSSELHKLLATGQLTRPPVAAPTGPTTPTAIADADALCRQADQLFRARRISQAIDLYERALHVHPNRIDALTSLGAALNAVGRAADALLILDQALMAAPHNPGLLNSRGAALAALGQHDDAIHSYQSALNERPEYSLARANLAHALAGREDYTAAIEQFHRVIAEDPNLAAAHLNLARCHLNRLEPDLALPALMNASRLMPGDVQTLHLLGAARSLIGQFDPADDAFRQAIALQPNFPEAHLGLAITLLVRGKFEQGWAEYEWRRKPANKTPIRRDLTQPDWDGSPLDGRTILIHAEQGMGDTLQFCRYIPDVVAKGGNVILECPPSQHRLLAASNLGARVESGGLPGHPVRYYPGVDLQLPLLSLPRVLGHTTFGQGGKPVPYLQPDPNLIELWRTRLIDSSPDNTKPFRIGLVWAGSPDHPRDNIRSTNLAAFQPLARDGVQFVSLQFGNPARQIAAAPSSMNILDITPDIADFADTAAIIDQLDLLITVDTAVAHLAGALAKPVWVLLPFVPDFRWLLNRSDTPWYPTMKLFRQDKPNDWTSAIAALAQTLDRFLASDS